jgi:hypothetical protein
MLRRKIAGRAFNGGSQQTGCGKRKDKPMKPTWIAAALAAVLALTAGAAVAQGHRDRPDLAAMDADGDGSITLEEMTAFVQARSAERAAAMFARLDADGDGVITAAEMEAAKERRADRMNRPGRPGRPGGN